MLPSFATRRAVLRNITLTTEPGIHGGAGLSGHNFGPAANYDAMLPMHMQFDFYDGGGPGRVLPRDGRGDAEW